MPQKNSDTLIIVLIILACVAFPLANLFKELKPAAVEQAPPAALTVKTQSSAVIPDVQLCPDDPLQDNLYDSDAKSFYFKGFKIHELAKFEIKGLLLSRHFYSNDAQQYRSVLSPGDFAIGWGPMSNPAVLKNFIYFQKNRFLYFACYRSFAETAERLQTDFHVANVHLIPANETIAEALNSINPRDIVILKGSLVEVYYNEQKIWKSAMTNTATGDGACKLLFLKEIEWMSHPDATGNIPLPREPQPNELEPEYRPRTIGSPTA